METFTLKTCFNRGNARIWIEGTRLTNAGIRKGREYVKRFVSSDSDNATLFLNFSGNGEGRKTRVAGTDNRPIIDICSRQISDFLNGAEKYRVTINENEIMIEPVKG